MDRQTRKPLTFGPFELNLEHSLLFRGDKVVPLQTGPFTVLKALFEKRGKFVETIHLAELAGLRTSPNSVRPAVSISLRKIREALGDCAFYIECIEKVGCRLKEETPLLLGDLAARLEQLCGREEEIKEVFEMTGYSTAVAIDSAFEIHRSPDYSGWKRDDIEIELTKEPILLFSDFNDLVGVDRNPPKLPNNKKYRICGLDRDSTEDRTLHIRLAPTDYFTTDRVERLNRKGCLRDVDGRKISPFAKYGRDLLNFEASKIPHKVGLECVVALRDEKLLLGRRQKNGVRFEGGKWSLSFEENMDAGGAREKPDKDFFDTVIAGVDEELGIRDCPISSVRILSLMMHAGALAVFATALVNLLDHTVHDVRAAWDLRSRDGRKEIKEFEVIEWTLPALVPMLLRKKTILKSGLTILPEEWHWTARSRALLALFHKFGVTETLRGLEDSEGR